MIISTSILNKINLIKNKIIFSKRKICDASFFEIFIVRDKYYMKQ